MQPAANPGDMAKYDYMGKMLIGTCSCMIRNDDILQINGIFKATLWQRIRNCVSLHFEIQIRPSLQSPTPPSRLDFCKPEDL
jgi:hypothetical protein